MKRFQYVVTAACAVLVWTTCTINSVNAQECTGRAPSYTLDQITVVGIDPQSDDAKAILTVYNDLVTASNNHNIDDILKHYNPKFISGDNLTLEQIKNLIEETWKAYPDICYDSKPVELRVSGDWATIETKDHATATAPADKDVIDTPGKLVSDSRSLQFLRRTGSAWEITSDATLWELATIRYGLSDDTKITLSAPEQVKAGETYSATIQTDIPSGTFSIATIDNQALTYPHEKTDDKFRALDEESNALQRVLTANSTNHNEIVTATLGLTSVDQKNPDRPSLALNGIVTIVKRVNVVPISQEDVMAAMKAKEQVRVSADGKIDMTNQQPEMSNSVVPEVSFPQGDEDDNNETSPPASTPEESAPQE